MFSKKAPVAVEGVDDFMGLTWVIEMGGRHAIVSYVLIGAVEVLVLGLTLYWLGRGRSDEPPSSSVAADKASAAPPAAAAASTFVAKLTSVITRKPYFSFSSPALEKAYLKRTVRENMKSAEYYCYVVLAVHVLLLHFTVKRAREKLFFHPWSQS